MLLAVLSYFNCNKRVFSADYKSYSFKTDRRNSCFGEDAVESKVRRRGARKLCCGASILLCLPLSRSTRKRMLLLPGDLGSGKYILGEWYFCNPIIIVFESY